MPKVLFLVSSKNLGDVEQKNAIFQAISLKFEVYQEIDIIQDSALEDYRLFLEQNSQNQLIIIAIGTHGQNFLLSAKFANELKNSYVVLSTHQYSGEISELVDNKIIDHLIIPASALDFRAKTKLNNINKTALLTVPSKPVDLKMLFDNWSYKETINLKDKFIVVTLPGDAPIAQERLSSDVIADDNQQIIRRFSQESANQLFNNLVHLQNQLGSDYKFIIQNGPRTGKYDENGKVICSHIWNEDLDNPESVDRVSKHFIDLFKEKNIEFSFFPFTFKGGKPVSAYMPLLYVGSMEPNYFITPGESVSMLSQVPGYVPADRHIVFIPDSMNEQHKRIFDNLAAVGYYSFFENGEGFAQSVSYPEIEAPLYNAEKALNFIADEIMSGVNNKFSAACLER